MSELNYSHVLPEERKIEIDDIISKMVDLVILHLVSESGDGDVSILFGNDEHGKKHLKKFQEMFLERYRPKGKDPWIWDHTDKLKSPPIDLDDDDLWVVLSDGLNENLTLTTCLKLYDSAPSWVGLKLEFWSHRGMRRKNND